MEENTEKKEKKQIKISLETAICIFIIIILSLVMVGTILYYNSKIQKENENENKMEIIEENVDEIAKKLYERAEDEIVILHAKGDLTEEYNLKSPRVEKEINGETYVATTEKYEVIENKYKEIFTGEALENILKTWRYANVDGELYIALAGGGSGWNTTITYLEKKEVNDEEITYVGTGTTQENEYSEKTEIYFKIKKVNGEYRISEMDLLEVETEDISQQEVYVYSSANKEKIDSIVLGKVEFFKEKFIISIPTYNRDRAISETTFWITGKYDISDETIKCNIENYSSLNGEEVSVKEKKWSIDFKRIGDTKIQLDSSNVDKDSAVGISLGSDFYKGAEFTKYDINDFMGTWKSSHAYKYHEEMEEWVKVESLTEVFGTSYINAGSTFTLKDESNFKDYVHPTTEGDKYRDGIYSFVDGSELILYYKDGGNFGRIYIIDENTMVYDDNGYNIIFLER